MRKLVIASLLLNAWFVALDDSRVAAQDHSEFSSKELAQWLQEMRAPNPRGRELAISSLRDVALRLTGEERRKLRAAVPALVKALKDDNEGVRIQAASAVAEIADARTAVPALLGALQGGNKEEALLPTGFLRSALSTLNFFHNI